MGHYNDYRIVVKPKPEYLEAWTTARKLISKRLDWIGYDSYPGVCGIYESDETPKYDREGYLEFRGNSKYGCPLPILEALHTLDDWMILIHNDHEFIECVIKPGTDIPSTDGVFSIEDLVVKVHTRTYYDDDGDIWDTYAPDVKLKPMEINGISILTNITHEEIKNHFDTIGEPI